MHAAALAMVRLERGVFGAVAQTEDFVAALERLRA
jgi:hypothetical protein